MTPDLITIITFITIFDFIHFEFAAAVIEKVVITIMIFIAIIFMFIVNFNTRIINFIIEVVINAT